MFSVVKTYWNGLEEDRQQEYMGAGERGISTLIFHAYRDVKGVRAPHLFQWELNMEKELIKTKLFNKSTLIK